MNSTTSAKSSPQSGLPAGTCPFSQASTIPEFPLPRRPLDPPLAYEHLRREQPISRVRLPNGDLAWLLTRYEDVRELLGNPAASNNPTRPGYPMMSEVRRKVLLNDPPDSHPMLRLDPPDHAKVRRSLTREFSHASVERLRPFVEATVDRLIDGLAANDGVVDFVQAFALQVPSTIIAHVLGVPLEDAELFQSRREIKNDQSADPGEAVQAGNQLMDYLDRLLTAKMPVAETGQDLICRLLRDHVLPGHMSYRRCLGQVQQLVEAGHETTTNMIALGTLSFLLHPEARSVILADPDLVPGAVEELLRYHTITHLSGARILTEDVEIGGMILRRGEAVLGMMGAANRDPEAFADPDRLDIHRDARHHLAFSYGIHQCLGQFLARMELCTVFGRLFSRLPSLRLAVPLAEISFHPEGFTYGIKELPVLCP